MAKVGEINPPLTPAGLPLEKYNYDVDYWGQKHIELSEMITSVYCPIRKITPFGNSAKVDAPKKYRGWRAYVVIVKD